MCKLWQVAFDVVGLEFGAGGLCGVADHLVEVGGVEDGCGAGFWFGAEYDHLVDGGEYGGLEFVVCPI